MYFEYWVLVLCIISYIQLVLFTMTLIVNFTILFYHQDDKQNKAKIMATQYDTYLRNKYITSTSYSEGDFDESQVVSPNICK